MRHYCRSRLVGSPTFVLLTIMGDTTDLAVALYASLLHLLDIFDSLQPQDAT